MTEDPYEQNDTPGMRRAWQEGYDAATEHARKVGVFNAALDVAEIEEADELRLENEKLRAETARLRAELEAARAELARVRENEKHRDEAVSARAEQIKGWREACSWMRQTLDDELALGEMRDKAEEAIRHSHAVLVRTSAVALREALTTPPAPVSRDRIVDGDTVLEDVTSDPFGFEVSPEGEDR